MTSPLAIYTLADTYFDKGLITIGDRVCRLRCLARIKIYRIMYVIPFLFLAAWGAILYYSWGAR